MKEVTLICHMPDEGTFGGSFWLVSEALPTIECGDALKDVAYRLYLTELAVYEVVSNPGGEDEIVPGAVVRLPGEDLTPIVHERLVALLTYED